jgi:hypothetical protein
MKSALAAASLTVGLFLSVPLSASAQSTANGKQRIEGEVEKSSAAPCVALDTVPVAVLDAPFLVFGEVHGTREVPEFVVAYLCAAAKKQRRITLAIEFPSNEQGAIDAFMASPGTTQDAERFTSAGIWRGAIQDGRTSIDMLRMVESIRMLRASGADIKVVGIDGDGPTPRRDAVMANNLRTELRQGAGRQVLALIGGLHAIRNKGKRFDPQYESAIYLLADQHPLALTVGTSGGTAWVCQGNTPATCHATPWDINRVTPAPAAPFSLVPPSAQFDGLFFVGPTTASPPAVTRAAPNLPSGSQ